LNRKNERWWWCTAVSLHHLWYSKVKPQVERDAMLDQMVADAQHKKQEEEQHQVGRGQGFEQFLVVKKFQLYVYTHR
jgi:hypothetical protein